MLHLILGDCLAKLKELPDNSLGAIVTDPPYGLEFQQQAWDAPWKYTSQTMGVGFPEGGSERFKASQLPAYTGSMPNFLCSNCHGSMRGNDRKGFTRCRCDNPSFEDAIQYRQEQARGMQQWHLTWLKEAFRVLHPDGVAKVFSAPRMQHRLATAMEQAGFVLEPAEAWLYLTGFPKNHDLAKAVDKRAGVDAETETAVQGYLKAQRELKGLSKTDVDRAVFGGTTRYSWVEGRGGQRSDETYLPTPEEWARLKMVLDLDDRYDNYIQKAVPARQDRHRADGGKSVVLEERPGDFGYQMEGARWEGSYRITEPASEDAVRFTGYGTALSPAWEPVLVGRKPA